MKLPRVVLPFHEIKHEWSCVAWGLELVMKMHEKIGLSEYPLQSDQDPCRFGFVGEGAEELKNRGIDSLKIALEYKDFETISKKEYEAGYPLIFSFHEGFRVDKKAKMVDQILHVWVAEWREAFLECHTRKYRRSSPELLQNMEQTYLDLRNGSLSSYLIDCLLHRPSGITLPKY